MTNEHEFAWAAGIFDGDGTASGYIPRRRRSRVVQVTVYQSTTPVLERFQRAMDGYGGIYGPYRGRLYHWTTKRRDAVALLCRRLWPLLSAEKRAQLRLAVSGRDGLAELLVDDATDRSPASDLSWAAGFFEAEGSVTSPRTGAPVLEIAQAEVEGGPSSCLLRFQISVGLGHISGPRLVPSPWSRLPQYRWVAASFEEVQAVTAMLWPQLGFEKRAELRAALSRYRSRCPST